MANEKKKMNVTVTTISVEDLRKMLAGAGKGGAYHYFRDEILRKINANPGSEKAFSIDANMGGEALEKKTIMGVVHSMNVFFNTAKMEFAMKYVDYLQKFVVGPKYLFPRMGRRAARVLTQNGVGAKVNGTEEGRVLV
jgi:hypothetical protein